MLKRVAFLDRDGTINVDYGYVYRHEEFEFIDGAIEAMKLLQENNYYIIIVSNQSGIARGYYSEQDFLKLDNWMLQQLKKNGIYEIKSYFCPHLVNGIVKRYAIECQCRKPNLKLYYDAIDWLRKRYELDILNSCAIGDKIGDIEIARTLGCRGYLIDKNDGQTIFKDYLRCWKVDDLKEAVYGELH